MSNFGMLGPAEKSAAVPAGWSWLPFSTSNVLIHILESCHKYRPDNKIIWWLQSIEPYEYHQEIKQLNNQQESTSDTTGTLNSKGFVTPDKPFSTMSTVSGLSGRKRESKNRVIVKLTWLKTAFFCGRHAILFWRT